MFEAVLLAGLLYAVWRMNHEKKATQASTAAQASADAAQGGTASPDLPGASIPQYQTTLQGAQAAAPPAPQAFSAAPTAATDGSSRANAIPILGGTLYNIKQGLWATRTVNGVQEWGTFSQPMNLYGRTVYKYVKQA